MCKYIILAFFTLNSLLEAKLPDLTPRIVTQKVKEIMKEHASQKEISPTIVKRTLNNYIEELDPTKTYFLESDIHKWIEPSDYTIAEVQEGFEKSNFSTFNEILEKMVVAIKRHSELEQQIDINNLPEKVNPKEFKDIKWAKTEDELLSRLSRIKALQIETSKKLPEDLKEKAIERIKKYQNKTEKEMQTTNPEEKEKFILTKVIKAMTSALDYHTAYFTPDEAEQFMISVQQRLFGIGAQLRDDLNGFTVVKIIEGGPAYNGKELKVNDRIVAVDGEPVVGMDIIDAVNLIRGKEGTLVNLKVIREVSEGDKTIEEKKAISILRGEVIIKEARLESSYEPFGDGVIAYVHLFSFYQDPETSSSNDLKKAIEDIQKNHKIKGLILDLRNNSGGLLNQAVLVTGLFITKGVVVTILDSSGQKQILRDTDGRTVYDGPLIVLINRASASASEIVAQTLQDYGRALIVGDDHSFGKGSFQIFTLNPSPTASINPQGEYKVTRGRYYTVSGKTPQLNGVQSDVVVPGAYSETELGEKYSKYPLESDQIPENFDDDLSDVPLNQRQKVRLLYKFNLQPKLKTYVPYIENLKENSNYRIEKNTNYQTFLKELKKKDPTTEDESDTSFGKNDLQLTEAINVMKDLILMNSK